MVGSALAAAFAAGLLLVATWGARQEHFVCQECGAWVTRSSWSVLGAEAGTREKVKPTAVSEVLSRHGAVVGHGHRLVFLNENEQSFWGRSCGLGGGGRVLSNTGREGAALLERLYAHGRRVEGELWRGRLLSMETAFASSRALREIDTREGGEAVGTEEAFEAWWKEAGVRMEEAFGVGGE